MNIAKRALTFFLSTMLTLSAWAERVSQEDASTVANNFMNAGASLSGAKKAPAKRMVLKKAAQAEESQFYIYENADGEGWVMVAANDIARPIIAYSDEGQFRFDNQPSNVKCWLGKYNKQIKQAEENGVSATEEVQQEWRKLRKGMGVKKGTPVVAALIKTKWDQAAPYYNQCPTKGGDHALTGCVATAMAQVMNYWQWPVTGTGSASVSFNNQTYTVDFTTGNYDWDNMLDKYSRYYEEGSSYYTSTSAGTTAQKDAVAKLMYHCGVAAEMSYGIDESGAYTIYPSKTSTSTRCAQYALIHNFGYNSSTIKGYYRPGGYGYSTVNNTNWHNYLKTELDAARPVMYAGSDSEGGHSFVCDGYDNTTPTRKYHFNWGWSGYCDGYYDVDALVPGTGGSGAGNGSYNDDQDIIIGIVPPQVGHNIKLNGTGCTLSSDKQRVENGNSVTITITPTDATYDYTSTTVMLGGATISSSYYTLNPGKTTLTINGSAITGESSNDLTITIVWTKNRYKYEMLGENCTAELSGLLEKNAALNLTITPSSGYTLADAACWDVTMGGNTLTYGSDFTYSGTTFSITSVTGDVEILAYGLHPVTWMTNGSSYATNVAVDGKITLPADPEDCSESKKFVGWCTTSDYSHATTAPTFAKTGDTYSVATYYAVYATPAPSSAPKRAKKAIATYNKVSSGTITDGQYLIVYEDGSVAFDGSLTTLDAANNTIDVTVSEGVITGDHESSEFTIGATDGTIQSASGKYIGNGSNSNGLTSSDSELTNTLSIDGSGNFVVESSGGAFLRYNSASNQARFRYFKSSTYTAQQAIQLYKKAGSGGGGSYTDYSTVCETCTLSSIELTTTGVKTTFVTNEIFTSEGLVVTANYSNCSSKAVIPNSVSTPDMSSAGDKTVTVSYTEGGETKTNTYHITVVAPKTVTYMACGDIFTTQDYAPGATLVLPTETPGANDGKTFAGWIATEHYTGAAAPTFISAGSAVNADVTYYAVFH